MTSSAMPTASFEEIIAAYWAGRFRRREVELNSRQEKITEDDEDDESWTDLYEVKLCIRTDHDVFIYVNYAPSKC